MLIIAVVNSLSYNFSSLLQQVNTDG